MREVHTMDNLTNFSDWATQAVFVEEREKVLAGIKRDAEAVLAGTAEALDTNNNLKKRDVFCREKAEAKMLQQ